MNSLLDTCALLGLTHLGSPLSRPAARAIKAAPELFVSPISAWEIAIKQASGKLHLPAPAYEWFTESCRYYHLTVIPLDAATVCAGAALPPLHRDPFDRVLIATALAHHLSLLTSDKIIPTYPVLTVVW
ncbi:MAG: hypothetical protein RL077_4547 [Verrucomicrobiota bacterium]|jgi:PIN domain nuclease of toxin-antitoxin system